MDLGNLLIESKKVHRNNNWKSFLMGGILHGILLGLLVFLSMSTTKQAEADQTAIPVYMSQAAPPPPPPPPPPPLAPQAATPVQPKLQPKVEPVEVPQETFVQPQEIPEEVPIVNTTPVIETPTTAGAPLGGVPGGVEGGIVGGVVGGVQGGTLGGQVGGEIGGVLGGVPGGVVGGVPGGTGSAPSGPLRVGGNVKAPNIVKRVEPDYTEIARRARIQGIVILEAIIDKQGNVDAVKIIRGLPMGLTESAVNAVKKWKFRPGTLGGRPVDVIFNLTVNFRLGSDGPSVSRGSSRRAAPTPPPPPVEPEPEQTPDPQQLEPQLTQPTKPAEPEAAPSVEPLPTLPFV